VKKNLTIASLVLLSVTLWAGMAAAQERFVHLKLQVVISRYQGEKKLASMPYTLSVNADSGAQGGRATLRMGSKIPVMMITTPVVGGEKMPTAGPVQYQDIGTNIDCFAHVLDAERFRLSITVDDQSIYEENGKKADQPSFRSFKASDSVILKDGQTAQFTAAVDKVTGESTRVDVTLSVVK
jgi:Bacterial type II and III secretion system protein